MQANQPELRIIGHGKTVNSLAFSVDGKTLVSGSYDHTAIIWDVDTGQMRRILQAESWINDVAITPDGSIAITDDGQVWDAITGDVLWKSQELFSPFACSPDGTMLAITQSVPDEDDHRILLVDVTTGRIQQVLARCEVAPNHLTFSADGELIAASVYDIEEAAYNLTLYDTRTGKIHRKLRLPATPSTAAALIPNIRLVALDGKQLWNAETGELLKTIAEPDAPRFIERGHLMTVCFAANGQALAVAADSGHLTLWDVNASRRIWEAQTHPGSLRAAVFTHDGTMLATTSDDHAIRLWDVATGNLLRTLGGRGSDVEAVAFAADGQSFTAVSQDGTARVWNIAQATLERQEANFPGLLAGRWQRSQHLARNLWSLDSAGLPVQSGPRSFNINGVASCFGYGNTPVAISPDGSLVALEDSNDTTVWNSITQTIQCVISHGPMGLSAPAFSPDNRLLVEESHGEGILRLWDARTGEFWKELKADNDDDLGDPVAFAFSADSRLLAVGYVNSALALWDVKTGKRKQVMGAGGDEVIVLAFSPNGKYLAVGTAYEETAFIKHLGRGGKVTPLIGHTDNLRSADFSPDGTRLLTSARDGTTNLWEVPSGKLQATFLAFVSNEWIIYTPQGYYTGSLGVDQRIVWREGADLLPVGTYAERFRQTAEVQAILLR